MSKVCIHRLLDSYEDEMEFVVFSIRIEHREPRSTITDSNVTKKAIQRVSFFDFEINCRFHSNALFERSETSTVSTTNGKLNSPPIRYTLANSQSPYVVKVKYKSFDLI